MGRLLTERKAVLIEITEDTTQPVSAGRSGSIELLKGMVPATPLFRLAFIA